LYPGDFFLCDIVSVEISAVSGYTAVFRNAMNVFICEKTLCKRREGYDAESFSGT